MPSFSVKLRTHGQAVRLKRRKGHIHGPAGELAPMQARACSPADTGAAGKERGSTRSEAQAALIECHAEPRVSVAVARPAQHIPEPTSAPQRDFPEIPQSQHTWMTHRRTLTSHDFRIHRRSGDGQGIGARAPHRGQLGRFQLENPSIVLGEDRLDASTAH